MILDVALALVTVAPARPRARPARLEFVDRLALPRSEIALAERRVDDDGQIEAPGQDLGRLASAVEIARVHRRDGLACELVRQRVGLRAAAFVQRRVRLPLDPPGGVPVGLAVAHEENGRLRHGATVAAWISGSTTASASSPVRRPGSGSR